MAASEKREYGVDARSTDVFGRVLCSVRGHHFVADGPIQNGCPGEELTPAELFLAGIASCAVELVQVIARREGLTLAHASASVRGEIDRANPVRADLSLFNRVRLAFDLAGVNDEQAAQLVASFKRG